MKLPLAYYGDPILRKKGEPVRDINDDIRQLVQDMMETMEANKGIGLAAPQVHRSLSLFITRCPIYIDEDNWEPGALRVFINPKIVDHSENTTVYSEGCLSIPKIYADITRPKIIKVTATDLDGKEFTEEFTDFDAHIVMHENDHINGVLFIDRLQGKERKEIESALREIKKKYTRKK